MLGLASHRMRLYSVAGSSVLTTGGDSAKARDRKSCAHAKLAVFQHGGRRQRLETLSWSRKERGRSLSFAKVTATQTAFDPCLWDLEEPNDVLTPNIAGFDRRCGCKDTKFSGRVGPVGT